MADSEEVDLDSPFFGQIFDENFFVGRPADGTTQLIFQRAAVHGKSCDRNYGKVDFQPLGGGNWLRTVREKDALVCIGCQLGVFEAD